MIVFLIGISLVVIQVLNVLKLLDGDHLLILNLSSTNHLNAW